MIVTLIFKCDYRKLILLNCFLTKFCRVLFPFIIRENNVNDEEQSTSGGKVYQLRVTGITKSSSHWHWQIRTIITDVE